jgi:hypothetical protein
VDVAAVGDGLKIYDRAASRQETSKDADGRWRVDRITAEAAKGTNAGRARMLGRYNYPFSRKQTISRWPSAGNLKISN